MFTILCGPKLRVLCQLLTLPIIVPLYRLNENEILHNNSFLPDFLKWLSRLTLSKMGDRNLLGWFPILLQYLDQCPKPWALHQSYTEKLVFVFLVFLCNHQGAALVFHLRIHESQHGSCEKAGASGRQI